MAKHTPGPWKWKGEDYRGDWGWQILVGPNGEGIIVGDDGGEPSKHLKAGCPARSELCITGIAAGDKPHVNAVHVYSEANAKLIAAAPELLEALKGLLEVCQCTNDCHPDDMSCASNCARAAIAKATEGVNDAKDTG